MRISFVSDENGNHSASDDHETFLPNGNDLTKYIIYTKIGRHVTPLEQIAIPVNSDAYRREPQLLQKV